MREKAEKVGFILGSMVIAGCRTISETGSAKARRFKSKSSCTSVSGKGNETSVLVTKWWKL